MGASDSKLGFRKAVIQLTTRTQPVEAADDGFWDQFWADASTPVQDVFALVPAAEIRAVREESPSNLATLCFKAVEKLATGATTGCPGNRERQVVLNATRLLTRVLPYVFEDPDWTGFFWSSLPSRVKSEGEPVGEEGEEGARPLAELLLLSIADLLFCPDFTVHLITQHGVDTAEDVSAVDSCEYIWEAGVGFAHSPPHNYLHDSNRTELLKLLLTCFSEAIYKAPSNDANFGNPWVAFFCSAENRHALPLFTSLLNVVCAYDPVGFGVPYNHLIFGDSREPLVEAAIQVLLICLDSDSLAGWGGGADESSRNQNVDGHEPQLDDTEAPGPRNLFVNYLSRIHREEDFHFTLKGLGSLLNNPLMQTYLPNSTKKINFHQELLVLLWKIADYNKKFLFYVLKSSEVLDVLVPILYYLSDARADQSCVGLMHIGIFLLLLLSGERNFGVRLNKPYTVRVPMDVPVFTGTHADLLIIVFHKIVTSGHQRLQPLFDCLLTIIVNVSPYLKSLSMVAANKLMHLLEAFSTPWFLFSAPHNHHLVFFLLEAFNNIIQYQFDGNSNLVYSIIRKRTVFHSLANLPTDQASVTRVLQKQKRMINSPSRQSSTDTQPTMEGAKPAPIGEQRTLQTTLAVTPGIEKLTEWSQVAEDGTMQRLEPSTQGDAVRLNGSEVAPESPSSDAESLAEGSWHKSRSCNLSDSNNPRWSATSDWVLSWKVKLPLQTIMRLLQVLVPQVEKICIDKGLTDESELLRFLQHGTLVGLLPVPHPILIRKYQPNAGTAAWFRTYLWGLIYLRNVSPPIWYDTDVKLFEIQRL
uniref:HID1 domain containing b n=1 Tax=Eptatretus burgeri TaxID=7764 RepID=A0A8C4R5V2_EPTBU